VTALLPLLRGLWPFLRSYWSHAALAAISLLAWHFDSRATANAEMVRTQAAQFKQAQAAAATAAQAALQHEQAAYAAKATETDIAYQAQLADARSAAARYIAAHSLHNQAFASGVGATLASPHSGGAAIPASVPTDSVLVSAGDLQSCTTAVTYAVKAHEWASAINP